MIGFALLATIINYLDRQVLSVVVTSPDFKAAVPLTEATYGYVASAFMLAYARDERPFGAVHRLRRHPHRLCVLHALVVGGRHPARLRARTALAGLLPFSARRAARRATGRRRQSW